MLELNFNASLEKLLETINKAHTQEATKEMEKNIYDCSGYMSTPK